MKTGVVRELTEEFRLVMTGRGNLVDSILPPILFFLLYTTLGFEAALWGSLGLALLITVFRLFKRQSLAYAAGGLGGVLVAVLIARLLGRAEGFFVPGIVSGGVTLLLAVVSLLARRPLVAWTSFIARRWPLGWYWHPRVRPAYSEVTWVWVGYMGLRLAFQVALFQNEAAGLLALSNVLTGWPATIALLVVSYLYGTRRLRRLAGPSVQEFKDGTEPPWQGQQRGF